MEQAFRPGPESTALKRRAGPREWGLAVLALCLVVLAEQALEASGTGPLTHHTAVHLLLMGLAAPPLARLWLRIDRGTPARPASLAAATLLQLALFWLWHAPGLLRDTVAEPSLHLAAQATLLAAAIWFWMAVLTRRGSERWRATLALLVSGLLVFLLGAVLLFQPAAPAGFGESVEAAGSALSDRQLAGLAMLVAGPLFCGAAAVAVSARRLAELAREGRASGRGVQPG